MNEEISQLNYEGLLSLGMEAREYHDKSRWLLGDVAHIVVMKWGWEGLDNFATDIGVGKESLQRYKTVSERTPLELRQKHQNLSWSHFRRASAQRDYEQWLGKANDNEWSVEKLGVEIKKATSKKQVIVRPKLIRCNHCEKYLVKDPEDEAWCRGH